MTLTAGEIIALLEGKRAVVMVQVRRSSKTQNLSQFFTHTTLTVVGRVDTGCAAACVSPICAASASHSGA